MKSFAFATFCLTACATDLPVDGDTYEIVPVVLAPQLDPEGGPIAGTLTIDTSEGRMDLSGFIEDEPRTFASWDEVHRWTVENFNAVVVENASGTRSAQLAVAFGPTVRYDAALDDMVPVEDPVVAMLGGPSGYIVVAGERICVNRGAVCAREAAGDTPQLLVGPVESGSHNGLFVTGSTSVFKMPGFTEVKTSTSITSSTQIVTMGCGFLRWCTTYLSPVSVSASITAYRSSGSIWNGNRFEQAMNTTAIAAALVGFGGDVLLSQTDLACGSSTGSDSIGLVSLQMQNGNPPYSPGCQ